MFKKSISIIVSIAMICIGVIGIMPKIITPICATNDCNPQPYFDKCALTPIVKLLDSATKTIDVQMFGFTNYEPIISTIKRASQKGVIIRLYVDNQDSNNPEKRNKKGEITGLPEKELEDLGIKIKWETTSRYMHRKIAIIDQQSFSIGSTNWSENGFEENNEVDMIISDCEMACVLTKRFNADWEKASETFK
jgi:phosphatidylserine/phosphatidylglycerophosphate/cardiolipin synthase-like enzyme